MKRTTLATILAVLGTTSIASARRIPVPQTRDYADPTVLSIATTQVGRATYRAVSGFDDQRLYLVIEELGWTSQPSNPYGSSSSRVSGPDAFEAQDRDLRDRIDDRAGRRGTFGIRAQRTVTTLSVGRQRIALSRARYLTVQSWNNSRLTFTAVDGRGNHRCTIGATETTAVCNGTWIDDPSTVPGGGYDGGGINPGNGNPNPFPGNGGGGYDGGGINPGNGSGQGNGGGYNGGGINPGAGSGGNPPGTPIPGNAGDIERLRVVTKACGEIFFSAAQRDSCIQTVLASQFEMVPAIVACGQAIVSSSDRLTCVTQAATVQGDAAPIIKQCAKSFLGAQDTLTCLRTVAAQKLPLGVVSSCESAVYGSQERFRCMNAVASSRIEPVALISYCKENNTGSAAVIACIEKFR